MTSSSPNVLPGDLVVVDFDTDHCNDGEVLGICLAVQFDEHWTTFFQGHVWNYQSWFYTSEYFDGSTYCDSIKNVLTGQQL